MVQMVRFHSNLLENDDFFLSAIFGYYDTLISLSNEFASGQKKRSVEHHTAVVKDHVLSF